MVTSPTALETYWTTSCRSPTPTMGRDRTFCRYKLLGGWELAARDGSNWATLMPNPIHFCSAWSTFGSALLPLAWLPQPTKVLTTFILQGARHVEICGSMVVILHGEMTDIYLSSKFHGDLHVKTKVLELMYRPCVVISLAVVEQLAFYNQYRLARKIASNLSNAFGRLVAQLSIRTIQKQRPTSHKVCTIVRCSISMCKILQGIAKVCTRQKGVRKKKRYAKNKRYPISLTDRNDGRRKKTIATATAGPGPTLLRSDHIISVLAMVGSLCALGRCMSEMQFFLCTNTSFSPVPFMGRLGAYRFHSLVSDQPEKQRGRRLEKHLLTAIFLNET